MRLTIASAVVALAALAAQPALGALPRARADRPDDWGSRPQVHAFYVVPSDGPDRALDTNGTIQASVDAFQRWLASQAGGRSLRMDTAAGALDVTYHLLPFPGAAYEASGPFVRDRIESDLRAAGLLRDGKLYAVWYDGSSTFACGGAAWPPVLPGSVGALYLRGRPPGSAPCESNAFAAPGAPPRYWEFAMLHEIVHTLGFVAACAPNHTLAGHTSDDPRDLMYAGRLGWAPQFLDVGRDDYFGHSVSGCADLEDSPFLTAAGEQRPVSIVRLGSVSHGAARAGRRFAVAARARFEGPQAEPSVTCSARLFARTLHAVSAVVEGETARCTFALPRSARGKMLTVTLRVRYGSSGATHAFRVRVGR